jgi:signal transduction histidine kinase
VKYTPRGGTIAVRLAPRERADGDSTVAVEVTDSGDGIPRNQQEAVFGEFTRQERHNQLAGVGLGLAISRQIARLLGGDLTLASQPSVGSTFTLELPIDVGR